jgi:hypothetical protein
VEESQVVCVHGQKPNCIKVVTMSLDSKCRTLDERGQGTLLQIPKLVQLLLPLSAKLNNKGLNILTGSDSGPIISDNLCPFAFDLFQLHVQKGIRKRWKVYF